MNKNQIYQLDGDIVNLFKDNLSADELQPSVELLSCLQTLYSFIKPLAIHLSLGCHEMEYLSFTTQVRPTSRAWYLYSKKFPEGVELLTPPQSSQFSVCSEFTPESVVRWVEQVLDQAGSCPEPYKTSWESLEIISVQARIPDVDDFAMLDSLAVASKGGSFHYPFQKQEDGTWIYGPINAPSFYAKSPFYVQVWQDCGTITLNLSIKLSLWTNPSLAGYRVIQDMIANLQKKGWQLKWPQVAE